MLGRDLPACETEYRFHPPRLWRLDFCWPDQKVAVEIEGSVWTNGRHTRGSGFTKDLEKYNQLTLDGFRLLRFTSDSLKNDPTGCIASVRQLLS